MLSTEVRTSAGKAVTPVASSFMRSFAVCDRNGASPSTTSTAGGCQRRMFCSAYSDAGKTNENFQFQAPKRPTFEDVLRSCMVLQVTDIESLSPKALKERYREFTLKHHPDAGGSADKMREISHAFDVLQTLSTREKREYVKQLRQRGRADPRNFDAAGAEGDGGAPVNSLLRHKASAAFSGYSDQYRPNGRQQAEAQIRIRRKCRHSNPLNYAAQSAASAANADLYGAFRQEPAWTKQPSRHTSSSPCSGATGAPSYGAGGQQQMSAEDQEDLNHFAYADGHRHTSTSALNQMRQKQFTILMATTWTAIMYLLFSGWEAIRQQTMSATVTPVSSRGKQTQQQPHRLRSAAPVSSPVAPLSAEEQAQLHQKRTELNESIRQARLRGVYNGWQEGHGTAPSSSSSTPFVAASQTEVRLLIAERDAVNAQIEAQCLPREAPADEPIFATA